MANGEEYYCEGRLNRVARNIRTCMDLHQFDPTTRENLGSKLLLVISELVEAYEAVRDERFITYYAHDNTLPFPYAKPQGFPSELADAFIRLLDITAALGIDIEAEITMKMAYNETRAVKHGRASGL